MSKASTKRLAWKLFVLGVLAGGLFILNSTRLVRAGLDGNGACSGCGTTLDSCYATCDAMNPPAPNTCYTSCLSNWNGCVSGSCYNLNPFPEQRTPCTGTYNVALYNCSTGNVPPGYQSSYDACTTQGGTVDDCCDLIAMMAYDQCCTVNYCAP